MGRDQKNQHGFTIIEVMIILAIAAIILVVVFLAVPHLKRVSRDNQRKQAIQLLAASMEEYKANTGAYPNDTNLANFVSSYTSNTILANYQIFINTMGYSKVCNDYFHGQSASDRIAITYNTASTSGSTYIISVRLESNATACVGDATT